MRLSLYPQRERYNTRICAAGAEPQLHSYKRRMSSKSFTGRASDGFTLPGLQSGNPRAALLGPCGAAVAQPASTLVTSWMKKTSPLSIMKRRLRERSQRDLREISARSKRNKLTSEGRHWWLYCLRGTPFTYERRSTPLPLQLPRLRSFRSSGRV